MSTNAEFLSGFGALKDSAVIFIYSGKTNAFLDNIKTVKLDSVLRNSCDMPMNASFYSIHFRGSRQ